jgi:hypothetical protein
MKQVAREAGVLVRRIEASAQRSPARLGDSQACGPASRREARFDQLGNEFSRKAVCQKRCRSASIGRSSKHGEGTANIRKVRAFRRER